MNGQLPSLPRRVSWLHLLLWHGRSHSGLSFGQFGLEYSLLQRKLPQGSPKPQTLALLPPRKMGFALPRIVVLAASFHLLPPVATAASAVVYAAGGAAGSLLPARGRPCQHSPPTHILDCPRIRSVAPMAKIKLSQKPWAKILKTLIWKLVPES